MMKESVDSCNYVNTSDLGGWLYLIASTAQLFMTGAWPFPSKLATILGVGGFEPRNLLLDPLHSRS